MYRGVARSDRGAARRGNVADSMGISLKPEHLKRYSQLARLMMKYGRSDLVKHAGLDEALTDEAAPEEAAAAPEAHELAEDLEKLGPTFIKLGQLLSTRVDIVPVVYAEALARLQDDVEPFPGDEVERIVEEELGVRLSKAFEEFDIQPMAAASLGQVHRAKLRDGRPVAVKVQRPGIREVVMHDMEALEELADFMDRHTEAGRRYEFTQILGEMRRSLVRELDYRQEASNLATLGQNLASFDRIIVPEPVGDYTTSRVLTMDYVRGRKITRIGPLARLDMDGVGLGEALFEAYLQQILVDGFFHADPHPGNVFLTDDRRLALIDVGMVGRITPDLQDKLLRLLLAISEARGEDAANLLVELGERRARFDNEAFRREITHLVVEHHNVSAENLQIGRVVIELTRSAADNGLRVPSQLTLLGKTLLNLDQVGRTLDSEFEPNAAIRRHAAKLMQQRALKNASPANVFSSLLEMNDFVQRLPGRLNRVLDSVADNQLEVNVKLTNATTIMEGLQKIANRIATGAILASLIIGASMMMRVETAFRILGYPGYATILFVAAVAGGVLLVVDITLHDRRTRRDTKR
jgi:ubiquinone biosynthesis protein